MKEEAAQRRLVLQDVECCLPSLCNKCTTSAGTRNDVFTKNEVAAIVAFFKLQDTWIFALAWEESNINGGLYPVWAGERIIISNLPGYPPLYKSTQVFPYIQPSLYQTCPGEHMVFKILPVYPGKCVGQCTPAEEPKALAQLKKNT